MSEQKYYWLSYVTTNTADQTHGYLNTVSEKHPFEAINEMKVAEVESGDTYMSTLLQFKEITKEEFDLFYMLNLF